MNYYIQLTTIFLAVGLCPLVVSAQQLGHESLVSEKPVNDGFALFVQGQVATLIADSSDYAGVLFPFITTKPWQPVNGTT